MTNGPAMPPTPPGSGVAGPPGSQPTDPYGLAGAARPGPQPPSPYGPSSHDNPQSASSPHPAVRPAAPPGRPERPLRPVVSMLACVMSTTAAMQFGCVVLFVWFMAQVVRTSFDPFDTVEGVFLHMAERFHLGMTGGLVWPLLGIPTLTVVAGFLLLRPRDWTRICYSTLGVIALAWSAFWLQDDLRWWIAPAIYIAFCTCIVWTPGATRWYGEGSRRARARRSGRADTMTS